MTKKQWEKPNVSNLQTTLRRDALLHLNMKRPTFCVPASLKTATPRRKYGRAPVAPTVFRQHQTARLVKRKRDLSSLHAVSHGTNLKLSDSVKVSVLASGDRSVLDPTAENSLHSRVDQEIVPSNTMSCKAGAVAPFHQQTDFRPTRHLSGDDYEPLLSLFHLHPTEQCSETTSARTILTPTTLCTGQVGYFLSESDIFG